MEVKQQKGLMIGNIVKRKYYNPLPDNPTYQFEPCYVKSIGISKLHVTESLNLKHNKLIKIDYNSILPIELTEEWLFRFGFKRELVYYHFRLGNRLIVLRDGVFCDYGTGRKLEYVHILQNLYSILEEKEPQLIS
jgi:hypothetical protein